MKDRGFTIVEVVAALSIFLMLSVGLGASMVAGFKLSENTRERERAREAARAQVEIIHAWNDIATLKQTFNGTTFTQGLENGLQGAVGSITVDDSNPALLVVRVQVSWTSAAGTNTFELNSLIADTQP